MYFDKLSDLGIKLTRRNGSEKTFCPQCHDGRKNKRDRSLSVNITTGEYKCFSADTEILTLYGTRQIKDVIGQQVYVLNGNQDWVQVQFKEYGVAQLYEIILTRGGRKKIVHATGNHEWFERQKKNSVTTKDLLPSQRLWNCFPKKLQYFELVNEAIIAGLIFGDGTIYNRHRKKQYSKAVLIGDKDSSLKKYFTGYSPLEKDGYCTYSGFPVEYKNMPSIEKSIDYLASWFAGYFAADGDVAENGTPCINSSCYENLVYLRDILTRIGISCYGISSYYRLGGISVKKHSFIHRLTIIPESLPDSIFINPKHKERFLSFNKKVRKKWWNVVSVKPTGRVEPVFCCEEPETHSFVLADNLLTSNCHNIGCEFKGNVRFVERKREAKKYEKPPQDVIVSRELRDNVVQWFKGRGISENTLNKFLIFFKEEWMPQSQQKEGCVCFPYLRDGQIVNIKYRTSKKDFKMVKDAELILFNLNSVGDKRYCIITEGEIDCMSCFEAGFGVDPIADNEGEVVNDNFSKWCQLSVPNGASMGEQKLDYLDNCSEWLMAIEVFVIATDGDAAGEQLKNELIRRLGVERCKTISYPIEECVPLENGLRRRCKDLNEVLKFLGKSAVVNVINGAEQIPVEGVYYVDDIFSSMLQNFRNGIQPAPATHFGEMDDYFRWKKGEINLFVGWANHGKTTLVLQMMLTKSIKDGWTWAIFSPENYPAHDFYDDLIEMYCGKWLDRMSEEEYSTAASFIDRHIFYVYPDDSHDIHSINEKFRYLVLKKGIDGVLVDPWNQLDHIQKPYQREDMYISDTLKDVKRFALLNCVSYNIIAHPVKQSKEPDKSLPPVDMYDIAGGAMWANKSDNIISYYRPNHHADKTSPDVIIYVQKIKRRRTGGKPGQFPIKMDWNIKRFVDPLTGIPFCRTGLENIARVTFGNSSELRLPYADDLSTDLPF